MTRMVARRAREVLSAFLVTFLVARTLVFLIMTHRIPDVYIFLGQTHVHHLNFGIVLVSIVGGYLLLFPQIAAEQMRLVCLVYGVGLGLTFDEFGMWFHLGGGYWQRASYDAVVVIVAVLALIAFAPSLKAFRIRHWAVTALLVVLSGLFALLLKDTLRLTGRDVILRMEKLDQQRVP